MSALNFFEDDWLDLLFTNIALPNVGDASGLQPSATAGSFYVSLQTGAAIPETSSAQTTQEAAYTNYARVAAARSVAAWTVASGNVDNDAALTFPQSGSGPESETQFGLGSASSGAGNLDMVGALGATLVVNSGITPEFAAGALDVAAD